MKAEEIRKLTDSEIKTKIAETKKDLFNMRLKNSTGQLEHPSDMNKAKKNIARMLTILKERELENNGGAK